MPSEFYSRMENQIQDTAKDNFRRGLLMGFAFLALFLLLEATIESSGPALTLLIALTYISLIGLTAYNVFLFIKQKKEQPNNGTILPTIIVLSVLALIALIIMATFIRVTDYYGPPIT